METMREKWTDERLDDFSASTGRRFDQLERRIDRVDEDIRALRAEANARFDELNAQMNVRFDSLQRSILQLGGGMFATFAVGFIGLIAT